MELILFAAAGICLFALWRRVDALEAQVRMLSFAAPEPQDEPQPAFERHARSQSAPAMGDAATRPEEPASPPEAIPDTELEQQAERTDIRTIDLGQFIPRFDFEDLFGRLLPIWAGGITLAVAGFFVVRYSIDAGLLTPSVRVLMGFLFGFVLLGGAEAAFRFERLVADERVRQALAGAGLATLYASFYLAGSFYGLIGPVMAFLGLAAVTASAIALSFRFGLPSAVLGLVGGFAAPALVGGDDANIPLLTLYLALITGGLMTTSRQRGWAWLGLAALGGGLGWGMLLLLGNIGDGPDLIAMGLFLLALGAILPAFALDRAQRRHRLTEGMAAGFAALQMAVLVSQAEFSLLAWGLFILLAAALAVLGWRNPTLRRASAFAALLVPALMLDWRGPSPAHFILVASCFALLLSGVPLALVWKQKARFADILQLCAASLGLFVIADLQFSDTLDVAEWPLMGAALAFAAFPMVAASRLWPSAEERADKSVLLLSACAMLLLFAAGLFATPDWAAPIVAAIVIAGLIFLAHNRDDAGLWNLAWGAGAVASVALWVTLDLPAEPARLIGTAEPGTDGLASLRWMAPALLFAALAVWDSRKAARSGAEAIAAIFAYGAAAQILPADWLAWFAALAAIALLLLRRQSMAGQASFAALAGLWAASPLGTWLTGGAMALAGEPLLANALPSLHDMALHLVPFAIAAAAWHVAHRQWLGHHAPQGDIVVSLLLLVPLHIAFKQIFGIADEGSFVRLGLAERTLWEALLLGAAIAMIRLRPRWNEAGNLSTCLGGVALGHWTWFTLLLHNPLWTEQAVGAFPVANLLLPAYGLVLVTLAWSIHRYGAHDRRLRTALDGIIMVLIALFAFSELRQVFAGSVLVGTPIGETEDLLRSLSGIVLAIGFLLWGAREGLRSWRIGSLVLMLLAVFKVFLVDASGLEGLARIASFAALGLSLIGVGWFYARLLR